MGVREEFRFVFGFSGFYRVVVSRGRRLGYVLFIGLFLF